MKLCGHHYPDEPDADHPGFWPVARALAMVGGVSARGSSLTDHHGKIEETVQELLRLDNAYIYRSDVRERQAIRAFQFLLRGASRLCRFELTEAFFGLFTPPHRYDLIRSDEPHGVGLLITDNKKSGFHFVVLQD